MITQAIPASPDVDLLFVIDNAAATADQQTVFASNFPNFITALDQLPGGRPNLHIGVVDTTIDIGVQGYGNADGTGCPSPDPADDGRLQSTPRVAGCAPPNGAFISDVAGAAGAARTTNYAGTLQDTLSCIAQVGATGCGFAAPLEAMKRALDGTNPANAGFLRADALLAVVIVMDKDDASPAGTAVFSQPEGAFNPPAVYRCDEPVSATMPGTYAHCTPNLVGGLTPPDSYAQFLADLKPPGEVVVAVVAGPPPGLTTDDVPPQIAVAPTTATTISFGPTSATNMESLALQPSCNATSNGNPEIGRPAIRLASFLANFGDRGRFYSICQSDYSAALADIGKTLYDAMSPCLDAAIDPADVDAKNPGTQLACTVTDTVGGGTPTQAQTVIPACAMTDATHPAPDGVRPCWWVASDPVACPAPDSGLELQIERGQAPPPSGDVIELECVAASDSSIGVAAPG